MIYTETYRAVEKARKKPTYLRTNEFIHTRLFDYDLHTMLLEMGPNCNLHCFHCLDECGPNRNGLPDPEIVRNAITGAIRAGVLKVCLTSGEPLREENKEAVAAAVRYSKFILTNLVTNGTFASTYDNAISWLYFLKKEGFDLSCKSNNLSISFGSMYPTTQSNFRFINDALRVIYPFTDLGQRVFYKFIGMGDIKDTKRVNELIVTINESFGKRRSERMGKVGIEDAVLVYPAEGFRLNHDEIEKYTPGPIRIVIGQVEPYGRAANLPLFQRIMPVRRLEIEDILMEHAPVTDFHVFYNGDVHFSNNGILGRDRPYGNVSCEHLGIILHRMRMDPLFQGFKIGGTPLLYHVAQEIDTNFQVEGRTNYDVSRTIFGKPKLVKEIREFFTANGVVDSYKKFIESQDLRKSGFHPREFISPQKV
ncbi:MAG: hypothetical protein AABX07_04080 [Nanoarchaeota archaeon]